ncbi:putative BrpB [Bartonella clarridgeiae 73]|uniref:Putative BrpB n=1 Tax=Bartonella clarridgeiae (strain CCUG 45776 / CIP 104772 / 73) TaxID=696125 RepID=E6YIW4_BARC7|nr:Vomp family autotransporter [Bartonella clarridgeiae]WCR54632.1 MAG: Surface protein/Bartonella adhesin [Bartonella clarridgeiae]CBI76802.1 putative BrpB [Bartonella clarridgeiae 73]
MKKVSTPNIVAVSLGAVVSVLLSSVSPVFSANVAITGATNKSSNAPSSAYAKGSHGSIVFTGDDNYCGVDNVAGRGGAQRAGNTITAEEQYNRFINNEKFSGRNPYGSSTEQVIWVSEGVTTGNVGYMGTATGGIADAMPEAFGVYSFATGCGSYASGNYSTAFGAGATAKAGGAQAFGVSSLATGEASVAMGVGAEATDKSAAAFGALAKAEGLNSVALGTKAHAHNVDGAVAVGYNSVASTTSSVAIGSDAQVTAENGVALGGGSVAVTPHSVAGYDPKTDANSASSDFVWRSTKGAVSIGNVENRQTRQIVGVAAGTQETDAVNVGQLKALRDLATKSWQLSVNSGNAVDIGAGSIVDFSGEDENIKVVKDNSNGNNNVKFKLGEIITVSRVVAGLANVSNVGFVITGGPNMTVGGISAGNKTLRGVADGVLLKDAVNVSQLNEVKNTIIAGNSLVKQDDTTNVITIGKETDGNEINIINSASQSRKISGISGGAVTEESTEAINGAQLKETNDKVSSLENDLDGIETNITQVQNNLTTVVKNTSQYFGGGADVLKGKAPDYVINEITYNDVGSAFEGVDVAFTEINEKISNITENSLVQQNSATDVITVGKETGGNEINIINSANQSRKIIGVSGGAVTEKSTEAVNGGQLWETNEKISELDQDIDNIETNIANVTNNVSKIATNTSKFFGGGANILNDTEPTYIINGSKYNNVGSAFEGVNNYVQTIDNKIDNLMENSLVQQDESTNTITIGKGVTGTEINIQNSAGRKRRIVGILDGAITEQSTEAVNGAQLWKTDVKVAKLDDEIEGLEKNITKIGNDILTVSDNTSKYFGGNADVLKGKAPNYLINEVTYNDVGSAFEGVDVAFTEINETISDLKENNLVQQNGNMSPITIGQKTGGTEINIKNSVGRERKISGVADGILSDKSKDAVNGSQLWTTNRSVQELNDGVDKVREDIITVAKNASKYFGGNADIMSGKAPTYVINGSKYNDVSSAFTGVDGSITDIYNKISNVTENSLVQQEASRGLITIGKNVNGNEISILNNVKKQRKISGVADGLLFDKSTEAVNGGQLWKTNQDVQELNYSMEEAETNITNLQVDLSKVAIYTSVYLGGGANVLEGKAPTYTVNGSEYNNVGAAFAGVDNSITQINNQISEITKNNLVQQDINTQLITIGKGRGGTKIDISEGRGKNRTLSGVKAAVRGNEAVNKDQLDQSLKDITQNFDFFSVAAVLYDKKLDGNVDYENITLGGKNNKPVALHNVKNGKISSESSDAVNGKQINRLSNDIANILGGGTRFNDGAFTRPSYILSYVTTEGQTQEKVYNDVGSAFAGLDVSIRNVNEHIKYVVNDFNEKIANFSSDALLWSDQEKAFVALHRSKGQAKKNSRLTFLLDGEIAVNSTDAITGNQLFKTNSKFASYFGGGAEYKNGQWIDPTFTVYGFDRGGSVSKKSYNNVADAFAGVNVGMSALNDRIKRIENQGGQGGFDPDALRWSEEIGAYDASRDGEDGKITNVADGEVKKGSKDAVNGGQLWDTNQRVTNVENKVDNISNKINGMAEGAVQYDKDARGKKTNKITLAGGDAGKPVVIDNVADGKIEKGSKEAVNGGQLHDYTKQQMEVVLDDAKKYTDEKVNNIVVDAIDDAVDKAKDYTDMKFDVLNYGIEETRKEARQAAAIGLAVSNLRYNDTPGALSVAFGSGLWRSQSALAFGAGYTSINGNIRSNVSVTGAGGHWGIGAGLSFTLPVQLR